jgi:hypothetical protein
MLVFFTSLIFSANIETRKIYCITYDFQMDIRDKIVANQFS